MTNTRTATDLRAAVAHEGCLICGLLERDEKRFFAALLYEQIGDLQRREQLQRARGFCAPHAQALARIDGAPMGVAILARSLLNTLLEHELPGEDLSGRPRRRFPALLKQPSLGSFRARLRPQESCPACAYLSAQTELYLTTLLGAVADAAFVAAYVRSDGLCLPHLARAIDAAPTSPATQALVNHQRQVWQRLRDVLDEFIRKHDYRYGEEPLSEEEQRIWRRAQLLLSGTRLGRDELLS